MDSHKYKHGEAFCHMTYASDDRKEILKIYNTRDGVTPFCIGSITGKDLRHIDWQRDLRDIKYKPLKGDLVFIDAVLLKDQYIPLAKQYVERYWEHKEYPMSSRWDDKETAIKFFIEEWTKPGSPALAIVQEDGSYKYYRENI